MVRKKHHNIKNIRITNLTSDLIRLGYTYNSQGKITETKLIYDNKCNVVESETVNRGTIIGLKENDNLIRERETKEKPKKKK